MSEKRGCFKTGCLGCLGLLAVGIVFLGITALVAWRGAGDKDVVDRELSAPLTADVADTTGELSGAATPAEGTGATEIAVGKGGRLVLDFSQGEFQLHPADPGQPLTIKATYDDDIYNLEDRYETLADSTWVYEVRFYRTIGGLQALLRQIIDGGTDNKVHVYVPRDEPIDLFIKTLEGGFEAQLGGLWLTRAEIEYGRGGFNLEIDEPLREPLESLVIHGSMGGFNAENLGNASPAVLGVSCGMGGANLEMDGAWRNDCTARLRVKMGGISVLVPDDLVVEGAPVQGGRITNADREVALPVLRLSVDASMGEVEVVR